jgi:hypothetical protein
MVVLCAGSFTLIASSGLSRAAGKRESSSNGRLRGAAGRGLPLGLCRWVVRRWSAGNATGARGWSYRQKGASRHGQFAIRPDVVHVGMDTSMREIVCVVLQPGKDVPGHRLVPHQSSVSATRSRGTSPGNVPFQGCRGPSPLTTSKMPASRASPPGRHDGQSWRPQHVHAARLTSQLAALIGSRC